MKQSAVLAPFLSLLTLSLFNTANACQPKNHEYIAQYVDQRNARLAGRALQRRQGTSTTSSTAGGSSTRTTSTGTGTPAAPGLPGGTTTSHAIPTSFTIPADPFATIPLEQIVSGGPTFPAVPLPTTYQGGAQPPIASAPRLPTVSAFNPADYPPINVVPPVNSPQVREWLRALEGIDPAVLAITPTTRGDASIDRAAAADTSRCWWTAGGCTNEMDVVVCPDKGTWGMSFDDGPSPWTPKVLEYLDRHRLHSTFFIVGSRLLDARGPQILQAEYMQGHQIAVHTWSHSVPLTALTNEEIVAELGWSRKIIQDTIGVTPLTFRPPWGDIDNRVRAIAMAMGLRPIIWTRHPQTLAQFDTNDWRIPGGSATGAESLQEFQYILGNASMLDTGFIVLQHDLWQQQVEISVGYTINRALESRFNLMDINTCLKEQPETAYLETVRDHSKIPTYPKSSNSGSSGPPQVNTQGTPDGNQSPGEAPGNTGGAAHLASSFTLALAAVVAVVALVMS